MRFYFLHRFLSVLLLLAALTCAAQGSNLRARRSVLDNIGNTLNNIGQTIKDTVKNRIDSIFHPTATTTPEPETVTAILESDSSETIQEEHRTIINPPLRCPPNHIVVNKRCRLQTRRRWNFIARKSLKDFSRLFFLSIQNLILILIETQYQ